MKSQNESFEHQVIEHIPKIGKKAEKGCVECPWYDIQKWRDSLNKALQNKGE